jgi:hypothetical protein
LGVPVWMRPFLMTRVLWQRGQGMGSSFIISSMLIQVDHHYLFSTTCKRRKVPQ